MSAVQRIAAWWRLRDLRERRMLGVMLVALAAFAYWYGLLWPLRHLRDASQGGYDRAVAQLRDTHFATAAIVSHDKRFPVISGSEPLARVLAESTARASVALSRQRSDDQGRLTLTFDRVEATALFAWLDALRAVHGVAPSSLRISRADGHLRAEAGFDPEAR